MFVFVAVAAAMAAGVVATINGKPITRADLERALNENQRQAYHDALADLQDAEHAAVRDLLGRKAVEREALAQHVPADSVYARAVAADLDKFDPNLRNRIHQQREQVFEMERAALDGMVENQMFEAAARARGMSPEQLTRALTARTAPVTPHDIEFIKAYEAGKQEATATVPPGEQRIEAAIRSARIAQAREAVIDSVRARAGFQSRLAPPRVVVSTAGAPVVGPPDAPIRIVVFTDFECPYCLEAEMTLAQLRRQYGDKLALFYLNYPLPTHKYARPAAVASMCAAAQGRYAAYHDLLFAHQGDLAHPDFAGWAEQVGIDRATFLACQSSADPDRKVDQDIREGIAAGVTGTPTFLVNGRLVTEPSDLPQVVAEEASATP